MRGDLSRVADGFRCRRCDGTIKDVDLAEDLMVDGETYECVKSFCYLGDTLDGDGGADFAATARIRNGWIKIRELLPLEMKGRVYATCVRSSMTYGSETMPLLVDVGLKFERPEMQMIRWMCGISLEDRMTNEELRRLVGVEPITTFIRSGRLRWYGHVMRKGDEDWVKKCMLLLLLFAMIRSVVKSFNVPDVEVVSARMCNEAALTHMTDSTPKILVILDAGPGWMS